MIRISLLTAISLTVLPLSWPIAPAAAETATENQERWDMEQQLQQQQNEMQQLQEQQRQQQQWDQQQRQQQQWNQQQQLDRY